MLIVVRSHEPNRAKAPRVRALILVLAGAWWLAEAPLATAEQPAPSQQNGVVLTYASAVQRAMTANTRLAAARLRRAVNVASRDVSAERLNPEFRIEMSKEMPKEGYTIAVPLELGGKRSRRVQVAEASIRAGEAELTQVMAEVQADVRRAYFALFVAERRQALLEDMQTLAERARDAAQARFDAGGVPRLEVVQAQLALSDIRNQATAASGSVTAARAVLNAAVGLPTDTLLTIEATLDPGPPLAACEVLTRARQTSAEIATVDRRIEEQRARVALAHALRTPDITPEATLTRRAEPEFATGWRAAVAVTLPIFTTHGPAVRLEEAALTQLTSEREATMSRISGEVASAVAIAESQRLQYIRYRDEILPQALELERMADDSYRLGQTAIAAYLQALQASRDVRLRSIQAAADLQGALADLERAIGAPLSPLP